MSEAKLQQRKEHPARRAMLVERRRSLLPISGARTGRAVWPYTDRIDRCIGLTCEAKLSPSRDKEEF